MYSYIHGDVPESAVAAIMYSASRVTLVTAFDAVNYSRSTYMIKLLGGVPMSSAVPIMYTAHRLRLVTAVPVAV